MNTTYITQKAREVLLYGLQKAADEPSASAYCQKVETFLRATSTPYEHRATVPFKAPRGKLPYIVVDNTIVPDSHLILRHLIRSAVSKDLDASLTSAQLADTRAYQTYIEELLYQCIVRERWFNAENCQIVCKESFGSIPWPIRPLIGWYFRRNVRHAIWTHGAGRYTDQEAESIIARAFEDLNAKYDGKIYFHSTEEPTEIDVIVYAFIANALQTNSNPFTCKQILSKPHLVQFAKHLTEKLFPEYHKILLRLDARK